MTETVNYERIVTSIATMLGWVNVPPQHILEAEIRALKARSPAPTEGAGTGTCAECGRPPEKHNCQTKYASYRAATAGAGTVTDERGAYVMAMSILQSELYHTADDELREAVDGAIARRSPTGQRSPNGDKE